MKHLRHQDRKEEVYECDLATHRGPLGDFWGEKGSQKRPGNQPAECGEGAERVQRGCREGAKMVKNRFRKYHK